MSAKYSRDILRVVVAQLCQTIGWHAVHSTPLELITDVLQKYITELGENSHRYAEQFGHTDPNLHDLGLAFRDMGINISDLEEYVQYVASVPCAKEVPKYPIERESHLNLLKPGSREVVTRPVHIHEHLPAMHPELEDDEYAIKTPSLSVDVNIGAESASPPLSSPKANLFKRPGDPIQLENSVLKRARLIEEEGRPLREISSVMMTTSGFLSPAREGKLPEARTPTNTTDSNSRSNSPQPSPSSYPTVPPEVKGEKKVKKNPPMKPGFEGIKKIDPDNKLKDFSSSELSTTEDDDSKVKKLVSMKETTKLKALKSGALKMMAQNSVNSCNISNKQNSKIKKVPPANVALNSLNVLIPKASKTGPAKSPKVEAIVPPSNLNLHKPQPTEKVKNSGSIDGKLTSEPDRQKLNIFKKISKVKEESKVDYGEGSNKNANSSSSTANGQTKEDDWASINETIESVIQQSSKIFSEKEMKEAPPPPLVTSHVPPPPAPSVYDAPLSDNDSYQFDSPPGTPRTPEVPVILRKSESKRKKKDKMKEKRENKDKFLSSPKHIKSEPLEPEFMEKPKTPEVESYSDDVGPVPIMHTPSPVFPFFPNFSPAPGLIPPPIGHPGLFPRFPPLGKHGALIPPHPTMPNLPLPPTLFMQPPRNSLAEDILPPRSKHIPPPLVTTPQNTTSLLSNNTSHKQDVLPPAVPIPVPVPALSVVKVEPLEKSTSLSTHIKEKTKDERKKEHKKEKKDKIKKKKDKKDKIKNKDKSEKKKEKTEKKERDKEKIKEKKEKKEKKREKEREQAMAAAAAAVTTTTSSVSLEKPEERTNSGNSSNNHNNSVPKITLKLGPASPQPVQQPPPPVPETPHRKIVIKPVKKPEETVEDKPRQVEEMNRPGSSQSGREPSPELARICALVTRPPKQKPISKNQFPVEPDIASPGPSKPKKPAVSHPTPKVKTKDTSKKAAKEAEPMKEPAPAAFYYDTEGNQVWICPGCGGQDDGSPMIGCDGCDAWYHWVCVGIQVPPDSNDWFCRVCIGKNNEGVGEKKKKMRKKKSQIKGN